MQNEEKRPLVLVTKSDPNIPFREQNFPEPVQVALFPRITKTLAVFVAFPGISETEFAAALESSRPTFVFELRVCPRFDIGRLNRREAFQWFQKINAQYMDVSSAAASSNHLDLILALRNIFTHLELTGPLMFLTDNPSDAISDEITGALAHLSAKTWEVCQVPASHHSPKTLGALG